MNFRISMSEVSPLPTEQYAEPLVRTAVLCLLQVRQRPRQKLGLIHSPTQSLPRPPCRLICIQACDVMRWENMIRGGDTTLTLQFMLFPSRCRRASGGSIVHASCYLECIILIFLC